MFPISNTQHRHTIDAITDVTKNHKTEKAQFYESFFIILIKWLLEREFSKLRLKTKGN